MFTGIVESLGTVADLEDRTDAIRLRIDAPAVMDDVRPGDSIAVNGVCLTVVDPTPAGFSADVMQETMRRSSLATLASGARVNLERAVRASDRLGGHIVQGHVDGTGTIRSITPEGDGVLMSISAPDEVLRYVVEKGSITVDGVSLTVASREPDGFTIALIPHTMQATTLGPDAVGRRVNLEADVVAKYVEALVRPHADGGGHS